MTLPALRASLLSGQGIAITDDGIMFRSIFPKTRISGPHLSPGCRPVSSSSTAPSPSLSMPSFEGSHTVKMSRTCRLTALPLSCAWVGWYRRAGLKGR